MKLVTPNPTSHIVFHALRFGREANEKGEYAIVRWDTDKTLEANLETIKLIILFMENKTLDEVCETLGLSEGNVSHIIKLCEEAGFIKSIDLTPLPDTVPKIKPWLVHTPRSYFSWLISKPLLIVLFAIVMIGTLIAIFNPQFIPSYASFFVSPDNLTTLIIAEFVSIILVSIHELAHFSTAKAVGAESNIQLSTRYLDLVVQTNHFHLAVVPKIHRYLVYLSGLLVDTLIISIIFIVFTLSHVLGYSIDHLTQLFSLILLMLLSGIAWEFSAYLETDMYNLLSDYFDQGNLYFDTKKYLHTIFSHSKSRLPQVINRFGLLFVSSPSELAQANDLRSITHTDRLQLRIYAIYLILGIIYYTLVFLFINLPISLLLIYKISSDLFSSLQVGDYLLSIKSVMAFILLFYSDMFLFALLVKKLRRHESIV